MLRNETITSNYQPHDTIFDLPLDSQRVTLDIRVIFKEISDQLLSEFRKTAQTKHPGGKGDQREDAFRDFLRDYLPARYAVGRGEVITPENRVSPELDIVIHDPYQCPALIRSTSHSIFPVESVYGAISMKSHLDSEELKDGYKNITSFKEILSKNGFTHKASPGMSIGVGAPMPVTGIVAYDANRSLDAIAAQAKTLNAALADITLCPDFIAVIGQGIIAAREPKRGEFNNFNMPSDLNKLAELRKTGRHTLLRLYMEILRELNSLTLRPLDLHDYDNMPRIVGPYRVRNHDRFVKIYQGGGADQGRVSQLNKAALDEIVSKAKPVTLRQHLMNYVGQLPLGVEALNWNLDSIVYEFNPNSLPPIMSNGKITNAQITANKDGGLNLQGAFMPVSLEIDKKSYAADLTALSAECFEENTDLTVDELMSM